MTTPRSIWLGTIPLFVHLACGGQFSTEAASGTGDAGTTGGSTSTGGRTSTGGARNTGGSVVGKGGTNPGTGGTPTGGSIGVSGAGGTMSAVSEDEFRLALVAVYCSTLTTCCSSAGFPLDQAQCQSSFQNLVATNLNSPRTGFYTYDPSAGARCLVNVRSILGPNCDTFPTSVACEGVFQGTLKPGETCSAAIECARGPGDSVSCDPSPDGGNICIVKRRVTEGQPCEQSCSEMGGVTTCYGSSVTTADRGRCYENDGLYCSGGVCVRQVAVGSPCSDDQACAGDATCDFASGICMALGGLGAPCNTTSECMEELHCETGQCVQDFVEGAACDASAQCLKGSCQNGTCSPASLGVSIICAALASGGVVPGMP